MLAADKSFKKICIEKMNYPGIYKCFAAFAVL
jgi:hypothetical protein